MDLLLKPARLGLQNTLVACRGPVERTNRGTDIKICQARPETNKNYYFIQIMLKTQSLDEEKNPRRKLRTDRLGQLESLSGTPSVGPRDTPAVYLASHVWLNFLGNMPSIFLSIT